MHRPVAANALSSAGGAQKKFSTHTPSLIFQTEARAKVRTCSYSCHSQLPVPLVVRQHVTNLRHGFLHLPVRVDLMEEREEKVHTRAGVLLPADGDGQQFEVHVTYVLTCTVGTSSNAWMKSSSSTAPALDPSLPAENTAERITDPQNAKTVILFFFYILMNKFGWRCGGSDLQTCCRRQRQGVEMNPCSPPSSRTARFLWTRTRSGRRPPSHRPRSSCLLGRKKREGQSCD